MGLAQAGYGRRLQDGSLKSSFVEIGETSLKKSKHNCRAQHPDVWLFGGVGRTTGKWFGRLRFHDRMKPTFSAMIGQHIQPGTLIVSDKFGSYVSSDETHTLSNNPLLADKNYGDHWVNHSENFLDPATSAHPDDRGCVGSSHHWISSWIIWKFPEAKKSAKSVTALRQTKQRDHGAIQVALEFGCHYHMKKGHMKKGQAGSGGNSRGDDDRTIH
ncbi:hypothetical protein H257_03425 [Aphanomyces astaci]|uniref:ISXO2-like transposase domain-containing protein n=1 Tax=Aphanomyces astaci TaxID=112090 RepID=W4GWN2_APHAT|nr:hypothetical protein H257_03425 [Aphanomyces astaci]ETV84115.1 hypothetical protein H257_03425 [Aphanomyces astaci]|eukprot:XP_009825807.1 hypothetical protein H257_03425 [Aphanomyces astaci]